MAAWQSMSIITTKGLLQALQSEDVEACGGGPIAAMMMAAQKLGAKSGRSRAYANSGDVTGDSSQVVGYLAAVIFDGKSEGKVYEIDDSEDVEINSASAVDFGLSASDKKTLLGLARQAIADGLKGKQLNLDPGQYKGFWPKNAGLS